MKNGPNDDESTTVLTARVATGLHRRVKAKLARRGSSFQALILEAVEREDAGPNTAVSNETPTATVSADESIWIQKVLDLLHSEEYAEAAKQEIGALHGAMVIDKALARVEEFAREAETDNEAGTGERGAKALEIIRAVKDSIKAARHAVRTRSDNTRGRRGNHGHSS